MSDSLIDFVYLFSYRGDINQIAQQFTQFYYNTFDTNREGLRPLYRDNSMLSWEGSQILGTNNIMEKLQGLPFHTVRHKTDTFDAQPSSSSVASLIVLVTGQLLVDDGQNPISFSQVFQLIPDGGSYYVQNDVFRLVYG